MGGNPFLGVVLHWLGGLASGSFYVPYKGVRKWSWETYWLVGGWFSWILCPWVLATSMHTGVLGVLRQAPTSTLWWTYFFGAMWGFGGLTFGLTMRYLGMSLGMGVALGYCAAIGTLVPPIFGGEFGSIIGTRPGQVTLLGVLVCLAGIAVAALAGLTKEREMPEAEKKKAIAEFNFTKGILVATFSGIMSACFAFGLAAGKPIEDLTYCSDLVHSAAKQGKVIPTPALVTEAEATNVVAALVDAGFFRAGPEETRTVPRLSAVVEALEAPVALAMRLEGANMARSRDGNAAVPEELEQRAARLSESLAVATNAAAARLAALATVNHPLARRLQDYYHHIARLGDRAKEWSIIAGLKDLTRKEAAVAVVLAGVDLPRLHEEHQLWTGLPVLIMVLLGGFTTNFIWCVLLNIKNHTGYQYLARRVRPEHAGLAAGGGATLDVADLEVPRLRNYLLSALAGTTWYFQFFFYTMGATQMGRYDFASWTLHMASIIIFSTMWGWILHEWRGSSRKAHGLIAAGIATLILSTVVIGFGTWLKGRGAG